MLSGGLIEKLGTVEAGGRITGDLVIEGDLTVEGSSSYVYDQKVEGGFIVDATETEALLVRKASDGGDVFTIDSTNEIIQINSHNGSSKGLKLGTTLVTADGGEINILDGATLSTTELNYVDGVTSAIQTQIDTKATAVNPTFTGSITIGSAEVTEAELEVLDGLTVSTAEVNILTGVTSTSAELNYLDITTLGTAQASKAVTADASGNIDFNNGNMTNVDIDSGAIDGTNITVGSGKTLDVSGGTFTLANNQISGDSIDGGTISAFTSTGIDDNASSNALTIDSSQNLALTSGTLTVYSEVNTGAGNRDIHLNPHGTGEVSVTATLDATAIKIASGTAMTAIKDEDNMASDSATSLATQQSIKAYVDAVTTSLNAQDLDFSADSGGALNIDLDTESLTLAGGTGVATVGSSNTVTFNSVDSEIVHDNLSGFVADEHIAHSGVEVTAGAGLTGGGTIAATRTLNVVGGTGITANANDIATNDSEIVHDNLSGFVANEHIDHTAVSISAGGILSGGGTIAANRTITLASSDVVHDSTTGFVANEHIDHSGVTLTAGNGLSGGGDLTSSRSFAVDLNELATETTIADADFIAMVDATDDGSGKITFENLEDAIFASVSGDITITEGGVAAIQANSVALATDTTGDYVQSITAGTGITSSGATSGENIAHSLSVDANQTQIVQVGTLAVGAISSGFGAIDIGSSTANFGATTVDSLSASEGNITNVGDIALDSISADGTTINVAVTDNTSDTFTIKQGSDKYLAIDTTDTGEDIAIGTGISGTAITIGHTTSETTIQDNLTITGNLKVNGDQVYQNVTQMAVTDPIISLQTGIDGANLGADTNKDVGLAMFWHNGSAAKTAFLGFDDSAGKLTFIPDATISSEVASGTAGTIVANLEGTVTGASGSTIGNLTLANGSITDSSGAISFGDENLSTSGTLSAGAITGTSFVIGSADIAEAELEMIDGITAGTAAASKAVVLDGSKNIATIGTIGSGAITATGSSSFATSIQTPLIEYTDGDDAITIADGGGITAAAGITSTAASNSFGATAFSGVLDITDATDSSDATGDTGALRTEGGASIAKKLYVGTDLDVGGTATFAKKVSLGTQTNGVNSFTTNRARFGGHATSITDVLYNAYWDGSAWNNDDDSSDSYLLRLQHDVGLLFQVSEAQATPSFSTKFSITNAGNVGINCTPSGKLDVKASSDTYIIRALGTNGNMAAQFGSTNTDEGYMDLADGGSTKVRIAASLASYFSGGNVGIGAGATSPGQRLVVNDAVDGDYLVEMINTDADNGSGLRIRAGDNNDVVSLNVTDKDANSLLIVKSGGNVGIGTDSPATALHVSSASNSVITWISTDGSNDKTMHLAQDVNRAYLGSSDISVIQCWEPDTGNVGIGTASPEDKLHVAGNALITSSLWIGVKADENAFYTSSAGSSSTAMYIGNQQITTSSDKRLKKNIIDTESNGLSVVNKFRVVDFNWDDPSDQCINNKNARGTWTGFLAQEALEVAPYSVNAPRPEGKEIDYDSESTWKMDYGQLVPILTKAIQELSAKVEALENG